MFNSKLIDEYQCLKKELQDDRQLLEMIDKKGELLKQLNNLSKYTSEYENVYIEYTEVGKYLLNHDKYEKFKKIERELNLFIMKCNKKLSAIFDLDGKVCK